MPRHEQEDRLSGADPESLMEPEKIACALSSVRRVVCQIGDLHAEGVVGRNLGGVVAGRAERCAG
jgi:hypothetical protein